jgi:hypothetical protein
MMSSHTALLLADACIADRLRSRRSGRPAVHTVRAPVRRIVEEVRVVGDRRGDRTPSGLWPSDHAGVVAVLTLDEE